MQQLVWNAAKEAANSARKKEGRRRGSRKKYCLLPARERMKKGREESETVIDNLVFKISD